MKFVVLLLLVLDCVLRAYPISFGNEVDHFTRRYDEVADANPALSREMNRRIAEAAHAANLASPTCSRTILFRELKRQLFTPFYGSPLEFFAERSADIPKLALSKNQRSIYQVDPRMPAARAMNWRTHVLNPGIYFIPPSALVRLGTQTIGIDKFGHFLSMGWRYYFRGVDQTTGKLLPDGMKIILEFGDKTERGRYGQGASGVYSYADLATNWDGFRFWMSLADGPLPYLRCDGQKFVVNREFQWTDYVSAAWDEGLNCSEFSTPAIRETVQFNMRALTRRTGRNYVCPIEPERCPEMRNHYGSLANDVISPRCRVN